MEMIILCQQFSLALLSRRAGSAMQGNVEEPSLLQPRLSMMVLEMGLQMLREILTMETSCVDLSVSAVQTIFATITILSSNDGGGGDDGNNASHGGDNDNSDGYNDDNYCCGDNNGNNSDDDNDCDKGDCSDNDSACLRISPVQRNVNLRSFPLLRFCIEMRDNSIERWCNGYPNIAIVIGW
ncbi:hypothetical protein E2542_SST05321 [Spatholobus suberectus]|nr:hypothetical protein E2542_SST05321 [Spatholobus suberectus]